MANRVELLAPCGSYESFLAAVHAGADAVYLGGRQFGARAYAENLSEDELTGVIKKAHLFGVKVYLTVNTLIKEREFGGIYGYIRPLYEAGLDGVIVQDMGVFCFLKQCFPDLKLHASTQMTITGAYGAAYLSRMGCERIVPARELSLEEIKVIKQQVSVEIETFIHGAMCYCYSGQCLMSSMIGGRSGNRGRCAGPCRLPYRTAGKEGYYLSLKDMNTLEHIPELIEAGIDSFKIEGRMKKPEYVAGVVFIYRKYIDRYYEKGGASFGIEPDDRQLLSNLYIRSETGNGYYDRRNGRDMLTLHKPGYREGDQALLHELRERYIHELPALPISVFVRCSVNEPLRGEVRFFDRSSDREVSLSVSGDVTERADKRAVSGEEIRGQLVRTGGTPFAVKECTVEAGEHVFVPMSRVKTLRRELLQKIYEYYGARHPEKEPGNMAGDCEEKTRLSGKEGGAACDGIGLTVFVQTKEQFEAVFSVMNCATKEAPVFRKEKNPAEGITMYLIVDADLFMEETKIQERLTGGKVHWGIKCPVILRKKDEEFLQKLQQLMAEKQPEIVYCATIDMFAWVKGISCGGKIAGEASLYAWNEKAVSFWEERLDLVSLPLELNSGEIRELCAAVENKKGGPGRLEAPVYGRAPFMVSANCIKLSAKNCDKNRKKYAELTDRMGNRFPVYTNCAHCYNIIYNYLPTSCYEDLWMLLADGIRSFRMEFTTESGIEAAEVTQTFYQLLASELTEETIGLRTARREKKDAEDSAADWQERTAPGKASRKKGKSAGANTVRKKERTTIMETTKGRFRVGVE